MKPKRPEIEDAVPLLQHSLFLQFGKRALDRVGKACRDIQRMMTGRMRLNSSFRTFCTDRQNCLGSVVG